MPAGIAAADEAGRHGHLRQSGGGALLACARLRPIALESAFMRMRPRVIRRIQHRVELVLIHQIDEQLPEGFTAAR